MIQTGIYGGSFNPIHVGHLALAKLFLKQMRLDEVWLMVSPQNPLKKQEGLMDDSFRLEMARAALKRYKRIKASDYEFHLPKPSYTWNTLQALKKDYPDRAFTLLVGGDNWQSFHRWFRAEDILDNYSIAVYPRQGSDFSLQALPPTVTLLHGELIPVSSTDIRQRLVQGLSIDGLVPTAVKHMLCK